MIYLKNTTTSQVLFIPKVDTESHANLSISLKSNVDLVTTITDVTDLKTSDLYYNLAVTLPEGVEQGEYKYSLMEGSEVLSTGLLFVGEMTSPSEYENTITYEQYETE